MAARAEKEVKARNARSSVDWDGRRNLVVSVPVEKREGARASDQLMWEDSSWEVILRRYMKNCVVRTKILGEEWQMKTPRF